MTFDYTLSSISVNQNSYPHFLNQIFISELGQLLVIPANVVESELVNVCYKLVFYLTQFS